MKKYLLMLAFLPLTLRGQKWEAPQVEFINNAPQTEGWKIYNGIVPDPVEFVQQHARGVVETLYWTVNDPNIPRIEKITYRFEDREGISAKGGDAPHIDIFYSSRWVEKSCAGDGLAGVLYETRGVLYHELSHGYQAQPKGCGTYRQGDQYWTFIEGVADAVRYRNGFFPVSSRKPGGHWMDGYRTTGFFIEWLTAKDPDFIRKFNKTGFDIAPWTFDKAMQHILGPGVTTDSLWEEYQAFLLKQ